MTIRIAMWSGPRNISTAMMRSFEARGDCAVSDEPFYGCFLKQTGLDHPMRDETIASMSCDWSDVARSCAGDAPGGEPIWYQKHMAHHMIDGAPLDWSATCRNAFLIRDPARVLASYTQKRAEVTLADIGALQLTELFDREAQRLGHAPPVVEGVDVLRDPRGTLSKLCAALGIPWTEKMLSWPPGLRSSDGAWAPAWYDAVEKSTGFGPPPEEKPLTLSAELLRIADAARPHYEALAKWKL